MDFWKAPQCILDLYLLEAHGNGSSIWVKLESLAQEHTHQKILAKQTKNGQEEFRSWSFQGHLQSHSIPSLSLTNEVSIS